MLLKFRILGNRKSRIEIFETDVGGRYKYNIDRSGSEMSMFSKELWRENDMGKFN